MTPLERVVSELLDELSQCLCSALEDTSAGTPCFCGIVSGPQAIADHCGCDGMNQCGQAWVRLDTMYAHGQPITQPAPSPSCTSPLAAVIELGVYRCIPTLNDSGEAPDLAALTNAAMTATSDAAAMVTAMNCCDYLTKRPHVIGRYTPREGGDCGGGVWPVTVALRGR